jgi:hypothetical protein
MTEKMVKKIDEFFKNPKIPLFPIRFFHFFFRKFSGFFRKIFEKPDLASKNFRKFQKIDQKSAKNRRFSEKFQKPKNYYVK